MDLNQLSSQVIKAAINVHKALRPGLLESVYQSCMVIELREVGIKVESEVPLPIFYRGQKVHEEGFRLDLLVEDTIIVELKSVEKVQDVQPNYSTQSALRARANEMSGREYRFKQPLRIYKKWTSCILTFILTIPRAGELVPLRNSARPQRTRA